MQAIFGGSFDPIHLGHTDLIKKVQSAFHFSKLFVVPNHQNPLKDHSQASAEDRLTMTKIAVGEIEDPQVSVLDWESLQARKSFTIETIETLQKNSKEETCLLLGDEVFVGLPRWKRWQDILQLCNILVFTRENSDFDEKTVLRKWDVAPSKTRWVKKFPIQALPFSSTILRQKIAKCFQTNTLTHTPDGLSAAVWNFIKAKHLYAVTTE